MSDQSAGPLLDALGVTLDIEEGQQLTEVLVVGKLADFNGDGGTALVIGASAGIDWVSQFGLLAAADMVLRQNAAEPNE